MTRKRLATIAAVLVVAILVATSPAAASHTATVSEHTTGSDFDAGSYTNLTNTGSGDDAQLELRPDRTQSNVDRGPDSDTLSSRSGRWGVRVRTDNYEVYDPVVNISSNTPGATTAYIETTGGTVIDSASISGGTASFDATLQANTAYDIVVDADGSNYTPGYNACFCVPVTSDHLNITAGIGPTTNSDQNVYTIRDISYDYNTSTPSASYTSAPHDGSDLENGFANLDLSGVDATVEWQGNDGSGWTTVSTSTYSTDGEKLDALSGDYEDWRVIVDFQPTTTFGTANLSSEGIEFQANDPEIDASSADPNNEAVSGDPVELAINVSDPDFGTVQGDELTVEWTVNGESAGTSTTTSNGTVTHQVSDVDAGTNTWGVSVTDSYGDQDSTADDAFSFTAPDELRIYNETSPDTLISGSTEVEVRFFQEDSDTVIERTTTDGTISMQGLPADEEFVVTVQADGYHFRRIIVDSLLEQQNVFLLAESQPSAQVIFTLDDATGQFDPGSTRLYVERALNQSNETKYRVIAGDRFGSSGEFPVDLQDDTRYRLRVENDEGRVRTLGAYTTSGDARSPLPIGRITIDTTMQEYIAFGAAVTTQENQDGSTSRYARVDYIDPDALTTELQLEIYRLESGGNETLVVQDTITGFGQRHLGTYQLPDSDPANTTYEVRYVAERDGETLTGAERIGTVEEIADDLGIDPFVLEIIGYIAILAVTGLIAVVSPAMSTIAAVGVAAFLSLIGIVPIPGPAIGIAGAMAVLYNVARVRGVQ